MTVIDALVVWVVGVGLMAVVVALGDWIYARRDRRHQREAARQQAWAEVRRLY